MFDKIESGKRTEIGTMNMILRYILKSQPPQLQGVRWRTIEMSLAKKGLQALCALGAKINNIRMKKMNILFCAVH